GGGAGGAGGGEGRGRGGRARGAGPGGGGAGSATAGTRGGGAPLPPCPPASVPCATMTSAPASIACLASSRSVTWMISTTPALRTSPASGPGSPKDSMMALGRCAKACSIVAGPVAQVWNPTPQGLPVPSVAIATARPTHPEPAPPPPPRP